MKMNRKACLIGIMCLVFAVYCLWPRVSYDSVTTGQAVAQTETNLVTASVETNNTNTNKRVTVEVNLNPVMK